MNKQIKLWQSILSTVIVAALILTGVFVYVGKLRSGVEQLYDGSQQLADGGVQIKDGTGSLNDGVQQYTDGVAQVDAGLGTLSEGLGTYTDGVAQVDKGLGTLQSGLKTYTGGVASIKSGTDSALSQAAIPTFATFIGTNDPKTLSSVANQIVAEAQGNSYATATTYARSFVIANVFAGNEAEFNRVMGDANLASDDATKAATGSAITSYVANNYATKAAAMANTQPFASQGQTITYQELLTAYTEYVAGISNGTITAGTLATVLGAKPNIGVLLGAAYGSSDPNAFVVSAATDIGTNPQTAMAKASAPVVAASFISTASVSAEDIAGLGSTYTADRAKRTFADASMGSYPKLIAGLAVMYKAIYDVNDGSKQLVAANKDLMGGVKQLKDGTGQLTDNNSTIMDGLSQLKDGTGQLVANNEALLSGTSQLADGSQTLSDGLGTLVDGVHTLLKGVGGK